MSSSVHARCRTVDKDSIMEAAGQLNIPVTEDKANNRVKVGHFASFDFVNGESQVRLPDFRSSTKSDSYAKMKKLVQLGSYINNKKKLEKNGLKCTNDIEDVILAVNANQPLELEFEEQTVNA